MYGSVVWGRAVCVRVLCVRVVRTRAVCEDCTEVLTLISSMSVVCVHVASPSPHTESPGTGPKGIPS